MTVDELAAAVMAGKPAAVVMSYVERQEFDGVSFFFAGPRGLKALPLFGIRDRLDLNQTDDLLASALAAAATVA